MTKFQKIQKLSSLLPVISTAFVAIVTMLELKRHKASARLWLYFSLIFFLSGITAYIINTFVMTGQHPILNLVAIGAILAIANILFVDLQVAAAKKEVVHQKPKVVHKKVIWISAIAASVLCTIAVILMISFWFNDPVGQIADMNGIEDSSLAVLTTDEILATTNVYTALFCGDTFDGEKTKVSGKLKDYDYDQSHFHSKKVSGVKTMQATKVSSDQLTLKIDSHLLSGNLEIIITIDGEFYQSIEANKTCTVELSDIANKVVMVKLAMESAELDVSVSRIVER